MSGTRILVVGPAWVGDMVMAQSLFKVLKSDDPDAAIDVLAPAWSVPLVARMPEVRRAQILPVGHGELGLAVRRRLGKILRAEKYARAIVLPRSFKAALVPFHARIPLRTGYHGELRYGVLNDRRRLDETRLPTTVSRYVALGLPPAAPLPEPLPFPDLTIDSAGTQTLCKRLGLSVDGRVVALMPGAEYGPAKQWPAQRFATLARQLVAAGYEVWVLGSKKERQLGQDIAGHEGVHNLCGLTDLVDVVDLLARAEATVSNDSGLMHIAAATGCKVVALYGASSPECTPPLSHRAIVVQEVQPCSPCFARTCRFDHYRCLTEIGVQRVLDAITASPP